ncbi:MAG: acyl-[acyl-carrier-protein]--UDP-N-acetylglucosamine O-acyltransferase [Elusimicrobia bacterium GWA2_56_46]|nr:MAG: acyl-[acyl-carrier-protein]--UDP-N-acetylglucosamine O-acyltransferase [Elusimicrobia bacterium GWA2_56_46]OGR55846.1 MAG: acyl-[acyl-carrier-protein]--UDP-N-acetylglucosamine O-acyltransferase [Elusimicrobia bacterium GWC2_56_31]HBB65810.1 acyl-[acyl-carrier-protein]--UDP-N-acetylglucosamine O-acyltransferase [Elusimicrobiota bacterium]HBW22222.1 acyl-[acyl-carrier-protein]--UDP-N-acetylglucosamine O-acyltransferase [Elusimicrobiota bacterium]
MATKIHSTAIIHKTAQLDKDVEIGPYAVIGENVRIGAGTYVGPHSLIEFSEIGKNNQFTGHAFIGMPPQDYKYHGEPTRLVMGDSNIVREGVSLHRGSPLTGITTIGSGCMFMCNSHVGHDGHIGSNIIMVNAAMAAGHVTIEDKAIISGLVAIHQFTRVGSLAMLSGGAMANQDIVPYCTARGDRARPVCLNLVGLKRNGVTLESIKSIKHAFKTLFFRGLLMKDAIARLKAERLSPEALHMVEFCEKSKRGVARPRRSGETTPPAGE